MMSSVMPASEKVALFLHQDIGGPCEPVVEARRNLAWGELIGSGTTFVSTINDDNYILTAIAAPTIPMHRR